MLKAGVLMYLTNAFSRCMYDRKAREAFLMALADISSFTNFSGILGDEEVHEWACRAVKRVCQAAEIMLFSWPAETEPMYTALRFLQTACKTAVLKPALFESGALLLTAQVLPLCSKPSGITAEMAFDVMGAMLQRTISAPDDGYINPAEWALPFALEQHARRLEGADPLDIDSDPAPAMLAKCTDYREALQQRHAPMRARAEALPHVDTAALDRAIKSCEKHYSVECAGYTPMHWAAGPGTSFATLVALLRCDVAIPDALGIRAGSPPRTPEQVALGAADARKLGALRSAAMPWCPSRHALWPASFRRAVRTMLLVLARLLDNRAGGGGGGAGGRDAAACGPGAALSAGPWAVVLSFCGRDDFAGEFDRNPMLDPRNGLNKCIAADHEQGQAAGGGQQRGITPFHAARRAADKAAAARHGDQERQEDRFATALLLGPGAPPRCGYCFAACNREGHEKKKKERAEKRNTEREEQRTWHRRWQTWDVVEKEDLENQFDSAGGTFCSDACRNATAQDVCRGCSSRRLRAVQPRFKLCTGCREARFCSKACLRRAWPQHKAECKKGKA
eukprot:g2812.t1